MTFDDLKHLVMDRRSVRYFASEKVTKEEVLELLDLAHLAPSIENVQPWRFHVVMEDELRTKLMETSCYGNFVQGAGAFVVVTADASALPGTQETLWNPKELEYSCMAAMTYLLLGITTKGLGGCWVSLHHGEAHSILKLPKHEVVVGGVMIGQLRKGEAERGGHPDRRALQDFVTLYE